jgi:hypothetical protein
VFFRQLAKLTPELAPTVVSEHETFDSVEQVLGHTSILRISCSKLWRHKFLQQLPKPIEFLRACQKLFGPDTFCELHTNMGHSTELEALLQGLALPSFVSISMYTCFFGFHQALELEKTSVLHIFQTYCGRPRARRQKHQRQFFQNHFPFCTTFDAPCDAEVAQEVDWAFFPWVLLSPLSNLFSEGLGSLANSEGSESRGIHFHLQRNSRQR